jgi:AcrR family transcriptional regulator
MSEPTAPQVGLRERTRRTVRAELITIGLHLFAVNGYDQTTIEDIATACGLSKRSFFRYFPSKEDLVFGNLEVMGERLAVRVGERPVEEPAWTALRRALDFLISLNQAEPERSLQLRLMLRDTPTLNARRLGKQVYWRQLLATQLTSRSAAAARGGPPPPADQPLRDRALAAAALSCFDAAYDEWAASGATASLNDLVDVAMSAVAPLE